MTTGAVRPNLRTSNLLMSFRIGNSEIIIERNFFDAKKTRLIGGIFGFAVIFFGCQQNKPEACGDQEVKSGHFKLAINWYEVALAEGDKVAIHKKMADIFANKLKDPASAAYHYRRILALHPSSTKGDAAKTALRKLDTPAPTNAAQSKAAPPLKPLPLPFQAAAEAERQAKLKVRTYVVQSGDSLMSISRKIYQTPGRWKDILDANQNQLSNPNKLKPGQTIILP